MKNQPIVNDITLREAFQKLSFTLDRLLRKTFSVPSPMLSARDRSPCIRQRATTVQGQRAISTHISTGVRGTRGAGPSPTPPPFTTVMTRENDVRSYDDYDDRYSNNKTACYKSKALSSCFCNKTHKRVNTDDNRETPGYK